MVLKTATISVLALLSVASSAYSQAKRPWWDKNIAAYQYSTSEMKKHSLKATGVDLWVNCLLANDERHRVLVDEDWDNKIRVLGYDRNASYKVIAIKNVSKSNPEPTDWWYNAECHMEIITKGR